MPAQLSLPSLLLYIPIWFYSNEYVSKRHGYSCYFTFQSGSIQIAPKNSLLGFPNVFTFQSGSIQIAVGAGKLIALWDFTFQSGSIQIKYQIKML